MSVFSICHPRQGTIVVLLFFVFFLFCFFFYFCCFLFFFLIFYHCHVHHHISTPYIVQFNTATDAVTCSESTIKNEILGGGEGGGAQWDISGGLLEMLNVWVLNFYGP